MSEPAAPAPAPAPAPKSHLSLEAIKTEIDYLAQQIYRNTKSVADTGRRVLNLESDKTHGASSSRLNVADSDDEDDGTTKHGEAVANDDLVQLVTELQGQLDLLDSRSIRRTANAFASENADLIAPLPGNDGFLPGESAPPLVSDKPEEEDDSVLPVTPFPKTVKQFKELSRKEVEAWLRYYELLPPDEAELRAILSQAGEASGKKEEGAGGTPLQEDLLSEEEADSHFDTLARFLGLRIRKTNAVW